MPYLQHRSQAPEAGRFSNLGGWQDYVNAHFPPLEMSRPGAEPFHAQANSCRLGECTLTHISSAASDVARTAYLARRANAGYLKVLWQLAGTLELTQDRRSVRLQAGRASLCDTTRPYRIRVSDGARLAVLLIPYDVDSRLPRYAERVSATELTDMPTMQAALGAITGLARAQPRFDDPGVSDVMQGVGAMLAATFARAAEPEEADVDAQRMQRARHYIATHLASSDLTPERLASVLCVSRRTLYGLLARHNTTPARLISETRLQCARDALARDSAGQHSITDIALAHGFGDSARFSHAFKDRFGEAPSLWRTRYARN
ncbi:helix-turn-helix domain-containing protein [uncultured Salinisphaera sp.]|uniref:AraC-like ligand-binding domain-containing protein n=1 Tax=uncultured Salinisphaera sp. TaxID=359372 RepID=UPI0032B1E488